jgi:hypothetical protein
VTDVTAIRSAAGSIGATEAGRDGPVVVLTYAHAGAGPLREVLSASPSLACTLGTGVIPLCNTALETWRAVEGRDAMPSALAIKSVRTLAATMIAAILAGSGATRWCEICVAAPEAAATFLQVFPSTAFLCLHRGLDGVLAEGLKAYPWGLGASPFWAFAGPHPGDSVATITTFWAARTERLLDFETSNAERCIRVRYEDLATDTGRAAAAVYGFLGLDADGMSAPRVPAGEDRGAALRAEQLSRVPDWAHAKVGDLHSRLGYPPLFPP